MRFGVDFFTIDHSLEIYQRDNAYQLLHTLWKSRGCLHKKQNQVSLFQKHRSKYFSRFWPPAPLIPLGFFRLLWTHCTRMFYQFIHKGHYSRHVLKRKGLVSLYGWELQSPSWTMPYPGSIFCYNPMVLSVIDVCYQRFISRGMRRILRVLT